MSSASDPFYGGTSNNTAAKRVMARRSQAFKAFKAIRSFRPERAQSIVSQLQGSRAMRSSRSLLGLFAAMRTSKGHKRAAAKRVLRGAYHSIAALALLPMQYALASVYPEGTALTQSPATLSLLANAPANVFSRWFGRIAGSRRIPRFVHQRLIAMMIRTYGVDVSEVEKPVSDYATLQDFFSRKLVPHARLPHPTATLVSPCDGELIRVSLVHGAGEDESILQVKGHSYPVHELLHECLPAPARGMQRWCFIFHLRPKDYHRFHCPADLYVDKTTHIPGLLHPVTFTAAKWIPHLFSTQERVVVSATWQHGNMRFVPLGATCVGSISFSFDSDLKTNQHGALKQIGGLLRPPIVATSEEGVVSSTNPRLRLGDHQNAAILPPADSPPFAQHVTRIEVPQSPLMQHNVFPKAPTTEKVYPPDARPFVARGADFGWFNWGSAIVLIVDLPDSVTPCVTSGQELVVGQPIAM